MKVLITGASSGLGRDLAKLLAKDYDEMILVARNIDGLDAVKEEIKEISNAEVKVIPMDISIVDNCKKLHEENPNVDLLINNAGFGDCGYFDETDLQKDVNMINTNIVACHVLTKMYLADMKKVDKGHILNVASIAGFMPGPLMTTYYSTKSYVVRLSESVREELRKSKSNVKISILCPGPFKTNFFKVANVKFAVRPAECITVAKYAVKHMNRFYIVPGIGIKLARFGTHLLPSSLVARITYKIQKKKL